MNVALVVMPFAAVTRPSLAVGLLQANLRRAGIHCEAVYANLVLGEMLGGAAYRRFSSEAAITALAGEWAFSQLLYGQRVSTWDGYREHVLNDPLWGASEQRQEEIQHLLGVAPAFLDRVFASRQWGDYDLVGFSRYVRTDDAIAVPGADDSGETPVGIDRDGRRELRGGHGPPVSRTLRLHRFRVHRRGRHEPAAPLFEPA